MTTPHKPNFTTQIVHADRWGGAEKGAVHQPIHSSCLHGPLESPSPVRAAQDDSPDKDVPDAGEHLSLRPVSEDSPWFLVGTCPVHPGSVVPR